MKASTVGILAGNRPSLYADKELKEFLPEKLLEQKDPEVEKNVELNVLDVLNKFGITTDNNSKEIQIPQF